MCNRQATRDKSSQSALQQLTGVIGNLHPDSNRSNCGFGAISHHTSTKTATHGLWSIRDRDSVLEAEAVQQFVMLKVSLDCLTKTATEHSTLVEKISVK